MVLLPVPYNAHRGMFALVAARQGERQTQLVSAEAQELITTRMVMVGLHFMTLGLTIIV